MTHGRVLLIEDEPALARGLSDTLRAQGFDVTIAKDGAQGLDAATSGAADLILLDVMLPKVNGFEICRAVRAHVGAVDCPLVIVNQSVFVEFQLECLDNPIPGAVTAPPTVAIIDGLGRAIALWNIRPRRTGMQPPEDAIEDRAMRSPRMASLAGVGWQQRLNQGILFICQIVASPPSIRPWSPLSALTPARPRTAR